MLPYLGAQLAGAVVASAALKLIFAGQQTNLGVTLPIGVPMQAFALEVILTFMLMFTIMGVATDDRAEGTMAGIAIGAVVALEAAFGGPISGASMNPARSFAPALLSGNFAHHWVYWAAPILGALLGAQGYQLIARGQKRPLPSA